MGTTLKMVTAVSGAHTVSDTNDKIKARVVLVVMGFLGLSILYALRVNLSVAIVAMVKTSTSESQAQSPQAISGSSLAKFLRVDPGSGMVSVLSAQPLMGGVLDNDTCPYDTVADDPGTSAQTEGEFSWNEKYQGFVLAGFFYGYAIGQLPGGILAERFGGKLVFGLGTLLTALLTIVSPLAVRQLGGDVFFAVRFFEGLAQGVTFPAIQFMISKWAPPAERSRFSIIYTGAFFGTVVCMPVSGVLCASEALGGWPSVFYLFGALGVVWYAFWVYLVYDTPAQHPRIDPQERAYIEAALGSVSAKKKLVVPWAALLKTPGLWACASMHLGIGWSFFTLLTCLPSYLANVLHYDIKQNALLSAVPYIAGGLFSVFFSWFLDFIITRNLVTKFTGYKIANAITGLGPAATLVAVTFCGCDATAILILLALNGMFMGAQYAGNSMNLLMLAPNFSGTTLGISNTFANGAGILAPYAVGFLTNDNQTVTRWNIVFFLSAAIGALTFVIYLLLCQGEVQPWNDPQDEKPKRDGNPGMDNLSYEP